MTITADHSTTNDVQSGDGWQPVLSAIRELKAFDVAIAKQAIAYSDDELSELREAFAIVEKKLRLAERNRKSIDDRLNSIFGLAALIRQRLDTDGNFAAIYADESESAIQHVKALKQLTD